MSQRTKPIVAIDGPAGAGKSTAARALARYFEYTHIDSGAYYRAVAHLSMVHRIDPTDGKLLARVAERSDLESYLGSFVIRSHEVGRLVPRIAAHREVRAVIDTRIREAGFAGGVVCDGRDIGASVFPDAEVKIFMTAALETRAARQGADIEDIRRRDRADATRDVSPLAMAEDATLLDTTLLNEEEVLAALIRFVRAAAPTTEHPVLGRRP